MLRKLLLSKIHRATGTNCDLYYAGSLTIDAAAHLTAVGYRAIIIAYGYREQTAIGGHQAAVVPVDEGGRFLGTS